MPIRPSARRVATRCIAFFACACAGCTGSSSSHSAIDAQAPATSGDAGNATPVDANLDGNEVSTDGDAGAQGSGGCHPGDISGFRPPAYPGVLPISTACSAFGGDGGLVEGYSAACFGPASSFGACAAFAPPDASGAQDCYDCLVGPGSADGAPGGVVANLSNVVFVDYAGCIARLDPSDAGAECATALFESAMCSVYACTPSCPVTDSAGRDAFLSCTMEASAGACSGYALRAAVCIAAEQSNGADGAVASTCFPGPDIPGNYFAFARYLCGG